MQEDVINVFCLSHGLSFPTLRADRVVICKENHVLSNNFPYSGRWFYCCLCQQYWVAPRGRGAQDAFSKQCPSCKLIKKARYYSCDQCNVTMIDSLGAINRKGVHITPWGTPHPHCPGCHQLPKSVPQSHACPELNGLLTTARAECPFCEEGERARGAVNKEESRNEAEIAKIENAGKLEALDPSSLALEEFERKASEVRALEAEAEAREAKAQERLRQVEARLRQEMSRRSEVESKSKEIEEELRRQSEIERSLIEAVRKASDAAARFEEEKKARIAAEQAKAEIETKLREMGARASERFEEEKKARIATEQAKAEAEAKLRELGARASETEERLRRSDAALQQEALKRAFAEERVIEAQRIEENYKAEIAWIRDGLEEAAASARQAEENHRDEMARITAEAESRVNYAENARQQYQVKVEEASASAQALTLDLVETQKRLDDAEARYREMETRAHQAEDRWRRLYLILKLSFSSAEQIIAGTLNVVDEAEKDAIVIPLDLATNAYSDNFSSETPGSGENGLMDYGDPLFSDRMRALFEAAARANAPDDKGGMVGSGE
jgi:DNA repair exonuclease SbcCD ATPase subunit